MQTIDIIGPLTQLQATGLACSDSPFKDGYLLGIRHAIELAHTLQARIDNQLAAVLIDAGRCSEAASVLNREEVA